MTIEPERDQFFQYATYVVVGLTLFICLCYGSIFLNPRMNPIGALQPQVQPTQVSKFELPATWTPTQTDTPTDTPTVTPTNTSTEMPTNTPTPTNTPPPTLTPIPTRRPPTARPTYPSGGNPTAIPPTAIPPTAVPPTAVPPTNTSTPSIPYVTVKQGCFHSGKTFVEGTVFLNFQGTGVQNGVRIRISSSPNGAPVVNDDISGSHNGRGGYYLLILNNKGSRPGTWYVWIVDQNGKALSTPRSGKFQTNALGANNPNSCWRQVVDFVKQ